MLNRLSYLLVSCTQGDAEPESGGGYLHNAPIDT